MRKIAMRLCERKSSFVAEKGIQAKESVVTRAAPEAMRTFRDTRTHEHESVEQLRKRIEFQSRYRGMVEMEIIFGGFGKTYFQTMELPQLREFDRLLTCFDMDLHSWLVLGKPVPEEISKLEIWETLKTFVAENMGRF